MRTRPYVTFTVLTACATAACACYAGQTGSPYRLSREIAGEYRVRDDPAFRLPGKSENSEKPPVQAVEPEMPDELVDKPYANDIQIAARNAGLDPALVHALIH